MASAAAATTSSNGWLQTFGCHPAFFLGLIEDNGCADMQTQSLQPTGIPSSISRSLPFYLPSFPYPSII
jgi:hypothetical protein